MENFNIKLFGDAIKDVCEIKSVMTTNSYHIHLSNGVSVALNYKDNKFVNMVIDGKPEPKQEILKIFENMLDKNEIKCYFNNGFREN